MNKRERLSLIVVLMVLVVGLLSGGFAKDVFGEPTLADGISFTHHLDSDIVIRTTYSTTYGAEFWKITDNKDLLLFLEVVSQPSDVIVYVEHMHADVTIHAYEEQLDGLLQDTMDDKLHAGDQPGFWIDPDHRYEEIFAVKGYSKWLIEGWMWFYSGWGSGKTDERRLTEENIIKAGAVGSQITVVYDILIEKDDRFSKEVFKDDVYVFMDTKFTEAGYGGHDVPEEERKQIVYEYPKRKMGGSLILLGGVITIIGLAGAAYLPKRLTADIDDYSRATQVRGALKIVLIGVAVIGVLIIFYGVYFWFSYVEVIV